MSVRPKIPPMDPSIWSQIFLSLQKLLISSIGSYSTVFKSPFIRGDIALYKWDGNNLILCKRAQNANDIFKLYEKWNSYISLTILKLLMY